MLCCTNQLDHYQMKRSKWQSENLFSVEPGSELNRKTPSFAEYQRQDPHLRELITYLERGVLPLDEARGWKLVLQGLKYSIGVVKGWEYCTKKNIASVNKKRWNYIVQDKRYTAISS